MGSTGKQLIFYRLAIEASFLMNLLSDFTNVDQNVPKNLQNFIWSLYKVEDLMRSMHSCTIYLHEICWPRQMSGWLNHSPLAFSAPCVTGGQWVRPQNPIRNRPPPLSTSTLIERYLLSDGGGKVRKKKEAVVPPWGKLIKVQCLLNNSVYQIAFVALANKNTLH